MLKLLLDEHVSPDIAEGLRRRCKGLTVLGLAEWESGRFLGLSDEAILDEAAAQHLTLVTYDLKTIPPLLKAWLESGRNHGGVIFVDNKTISSSDRGGLIRALQQLAREAGQTDWKNNVCFLRR
jgi:hypothetical protein